MLTCEIASGYNLNLNVLEYGSSGKMILIDTEWWTDYNGVPLVSLFGTGLSAAFK